MGLENRHCKVAVRTAWLKTAPADPAIKALVPGVHAWWRGSRLCVRKRDENASA